MDDKAVSKEDVRVSDLSAAQFEALLTRSLTVALCRAAEFGAVRADQEAKRPRYPDHETDWNERAKPAAEIRNRVNQPAWPGDNWPKFPILHYTSTKKENAEKAS